MELPYSEIANKLAIADPTMAKIITSVDYHPQPTANIDIYQFLLESIVSQQLSIKVADIIWKRFTDLFPEGNPTAKEIILCADEDLRAVGLSWQKLKYLKNVAHFSLQNTLSFDYLLQKSDDEIIHYLTQISGVGKWTVQMVLMFPLDRPDVFPIDDLGIQTKIKHWYKLTSEKKALKTDMEKLSEAWKPYRSLACKYLWKSNL